MNQREVQPATKTTKKSNSHGAMCRASVPNFLIINNLFGFMPPKILDAINTVKCDARPDPLFEISTQCKIPKSPSTRECV